MSLSAGPNRSLMGHAVACNLTETLFLLLVSLALAFLFVSVQFPSGIGFLLINPLAREKVAFDLRQLLGRKIAVKVPCRPPLNLIVAPLDPVNFHRRLPTGAVRNRLGTRANKMPLVEFVHRPYTRRRPRRLPVYFRSRESVQYTPSTSKSRKTLSGLSAKKETAVAITVMCYGSMIHENLLANCLTFPPRWCPR